ncbi:MAG: phosphoribosylanthranilate isomerase [Pedosphaera sp.]|nr:phosphoribosylanthranilate isomerase [Pedosphaera sp.]
MSPVRVKICGITSVRDALAAVEAGADALGFMFYEPSPRFVSTHAAAEIIRELPPFIAKVGVLVDAGQETIQHVIDVCGIDTLQFHGEESPKFCRHFGLKTIKAFRVRGPEVLEQVKHYEAVAWLLDSFVPGALGGTGATFNWDIASDATALSPRVILAGGLTPENVAEAVRRVRPFGIDVSSGVESAPGRKDADKLRTFIAAAKSANL